jgi:hypothetical protein
MMQLFTHDHPAGSKARTAIGPVVLAFVSLVLAGLLYLSADSSAARSGVPRGRAETGCTPTSSGQPSFRAPFGNASTLLPRAQVAGGHLCRYFGVNGPDPGDRPHSLAASESLSRSTARTLAHEFNHLKPILTSRKCPADRGARMFVRFSYHDRRPVDVKIFLSGCIIAIDRRAGPAFEVTDDLRQRLETLSDPR